MLQQHIHVLFLGAGAADPLRPELGVRRVYHARHRAAERLCERQVRAECNDPLGLPRRHYLVRWSAFVRPGGRCTARPTQQGQFRAVCLFGAPADGARLVIKDFRSQCERWAVHLPT